MRILHINTISRREAKKLAPWATYLYKKAGGFIATDSTANAPDGHYVNVKYKKNALPAKSYRLDENEKQRLIDKYRVKEAIVVEVEDKGKWFPFKSKEAFDRAMG